jgi:transketolase
MRTLSTIEEPVIPAWGASLTEQRAINALRILAMDAVEAAGSGHPGTPMGLATAGYALWSRFMSYDPTAPEWPNRDRFVMSNGHAGLLQYSLLHLTGFDLSLDDLRSFRQWGSKAAGHPERGVTPGVEVTTGPLGQGLGNGVGMAIAERMLASRFNRPGLEVVDHMTWVTAGDGDLMEGVAAESASLAGHLGLGRLIVLYDDNRITIEGSTSLALSEDIDERFRSYGWHVVAASGNDLSEVAAAIHAAVDESSRPSLIRLRTSIGYGSPTKHDSAEAHGAPLGANEVAATRSAIGWESHTPFEVPPDVYRHYGEVAARARLRRMEWDQTWSHYEASFPDQACELTRVLSGELPVGWDASLPSFEPGAVVATRKASGLAINALAGRLPELVGGSADLAPSTNTLISESGDIARFAFSERNFHFGVREHAMGSILNGIAAHGGFRPFGATFLVFSDYMRPAIRLSALMGLPVIYVMTHDSVGLGEDGPTHQPVEHLASLRAMPNLVVIRPADANETVAAWKMALTRTTGPTMLVLSRQGLPVIDRADPVSISDGARIVRSGTDVVVIATGSEVALATDAASILDGRGISARVVSMPSTDLFEQAPREIRDSIVPPGVPVVAVEAGVSFGWERFADLVIGLDRFGASAPGDIALTKLGFTPDRVAEEATRLVMERNRSTNQPKGGRNNVEAS